MKEITTPADLKYDARGLIPCVVQQYDTGAVSYTHLDVYKRQALCFQMNTV